MRLSNTWLKQRAACEVVQGLIDTAFDDGIKLLPRWLASGGRSGSPTALDCTDSVNRARSAGRS